jgi:hypothetical protein
MPVTQPVENQGEQLAGGGDHTDVAPAAACDLIAQLTQPVMLADALDSFHSGPADQGAALLGDPSAVNFGVGLVVLGVSPAQLLNWLGPGKRCTSPISATNTAPRIGPTPGMAWIAV